MGSLSFVIVWFLATSAAATTAPRLQKVAVLESRDAGGLQEKTVSTLYEVLLAAFDRHPGIDALGASDIRALLQLEEQRQLFDACADDSCLAEIGGALGASILAQWDIGAVGDQWVVNVKLIDVDQAMVLARARQVVNMDESLLIAAVEAAAEEVLRTAMKSATQTGKGLALSAQASPLRRSAPWIAAGVGVTAMAAGIALGTMANDDAASAQKLFTGSAQWQEMQSAAESKALGADILYAAAVAAAGVAVYFWLWEDTPYAVSLIPSSTGTTAIVSTAW